MPHVVLHFLNYVLWTLCICVSLRLYRANWVQADGHLYKKGAVILYSVDEIPSFGQIQSVYIVNGAKIVFKVKKLETVSFIEHYNAYNLCSLPTNPDHITLLWLNALPLIHPMHLHTVQRKKFVVLPYHIHFSD